TVPASQRRSTKKMLMSTRPTQNCGSAMPLKVVPRTTKSGQRSRWTAASTPSGMPTEMPSGHPAPQVGRHALAGREGDAEVETQQRAEIMDELQRQRIGQAEPGADLGA